MSLATNLAKSQTQPASTAASMNQPPTQLSPNPKLQSSLPNATKVTVEVPTSSVLPFNPFDPSWIKLWEQVGPISYLGLLCVFIWLLTRLVETVKGK